MLAWLLCASGKGKPRLDVYGEEAERRRLDGKKSGVGMMKS